jgi:hypothetical protein
MVGILKRTEVESVLIIDVVPQISSFISSLKRSKLPNSRKFYEASEITHEKSFKSSAIVFLGKLKFLQIESFEFPHNAWFVSENIF